MSSLNKKIFGSFSFLTILFFVRWISPTSKRERLKSCFRFRESMVFIWDGCSFHYAHVWWKIGLFQTKIGFDCSFDVTKCLQQIEIPVYSMCA